MKFFRQKPETPKHDPHKRTSVLGMLASMSVALSKTTPAAAEISFEKFATEFGDIAEKCKSDFGVDFYAEISGGKTVKLDYGFLKVQPTENRETVVATMKVVHDILNKNYPHLKGVVNNIILGKKLSRPEDPPHITLVGTVNRPTGDIYIPTLSANPTEKEINNFKTFIFHHEVSHLIKFRYMDKMGLTPFAFEQNWLNQIYGPNKQANYIGLKAYGEFVNAGKHKERPLGFARSYGQVSAMEDFSTVVELMFTPTMFKDNPSLLNDRVLMKKCRFVESIYKEILGVEDTLFENVQRQSGVFEKVLPWNRF